MSCELLHQTYPAAYAPFPYDRDRLTFLKMDGSRLGFRDACFDVAYSLSSIEHFGGVEGARRSVADMARVLKPGGILALATEWCVRGQAAGEVFSPEQVRAIIDHPRLRLVQPIDDRVWDRYETEPVDLRIDRFQSPHMLLKHDEENRVLIFPRLTKDGTKGAIEGTLEFRQVFFYSRNAKITPIKFQIKIRDRSLLESNVVETDTVHVPILAQ